VRVASPSTLLLLLLSACVCSCTSLPAPKHKEYSFPRKVAFLEEELTRPHKVIGTVRARQDFATLDPNREEESLCKNYYNKAVRELARQAHEKGADAVKGVRSVVFFENGKSELHKSPECSDEGDEGQVLVQGSAIKWDPPPKENEATKD
jgi:hypothetical protein